MNIVTIHHHRVNPHFISIQSNQINHSLGGIQMAIRVSFKAHIRVVLTSIFKFRERFLDHAKVNTHTHTRMPHTIKERPNESSAGELLKRLQMWFSLECQSIVF